MILSQVKIHIQEKFNKTCHSFLVSNFQNDLTVKLKIRKETHTHTDKQLINLRFEYLQVLGFLLLCSFGADLAATGGSGAQLRGDEVEHTLHHPPFTQKEGPVASCRYSS